MFVFIFKLKEIINFCTRPNWQPAVKLLALNMTISLTSLPIHFLSKQDVTHYFQFLLA